MSIRNNYPTVNPTLDLDFANTRRLDPRVTFSRSSTATYYDGSKALAEQNLLLNSQTFNTTWVASSITFATGITDPLGTTTAYTATASGANATVYQSVIIPADTFTFSIYIQRVTGTGTINLTLDGTTMTVASVTGSWVRYTATQALTAGTYTVGIKIVTSGDAVNIWGAQLEQRSSASAYNVTTTSIVANYISVLKTAAINQPRFDVDPVTGESKGLLIEEARTNLLTYSERFEITNSLVVTGLSGTFQNGETVTATGGGSGTYIASGSSSTVILVGPASGTFSGTLTGGTSGATATISSSTAVWTKSNATVTANAVVAPDGTTTGDLFYPTSSAGANRCYQFYSINATTTGSIYVKTAGKPCAYISVYDGAVYKYLYLNLVTNSIVSNSAGLNYTINTLNNGWYRVSVTVATTAAFFNVSCGDPSDFIGASGVYSTPNGTSGIYIWGAQLEVGAFPTSYIPTTSAQVTRTADNASMVGTNFSSWYNQSEGTVVAEADYSSTSAYSTVFDVNNGTSANRIRIIGWNDGTEKQIITESTTIQSQFSNVSTTAPFKSTICYSLNNIAGSRNGNTSQTDNIALIPAVNQMQLGSFNLTQFYLNGHIKSIRYYPARVTNAQLQALTSI